MNNLEHIKLEEICTITKLAGTEFSDIVEYIPEGEIIALRALNIKNGKLELQNIKRISKSISERLVRSKLKKDDIVMTATGTVGEVAIIEEDDKYHLGPNLAVIRPKNIDPSYLFAYMRTKNFKNEIIKFTFGSTQQTIPTKNIRELEVTLRVKKDQIKIGQISSLFDKKIALNNKTNETLEAIARTIFKSWFIDFDPVKAKSQGLPTGLPDEISNLFPDSFEESELGKIPKGWRKTSIGEVIDIKHGYAFTGEGISKQVGNNLLVTPGNFKIGGGFDSDNSKYFYGEIPSEYLLSPGEIIITMTDLSKEGDTLGYPAKVPNNPQIRYLHNQRIGRIVPQKDPRYLEFVYWLMTSNRYRHWILSSATGSTVKHTSPSRIKEFEFAMSSERLINYFNKISLSTMKNMENHINEISIIENLKNTLLPKLISGELRIPDAEKMIEEAGI